MTRRLQKAVWVSVLVETLLVAAIGIYAVTNTSGHTGVNPYVSYFVFIPFIVLGLASLSLSRVRSQALMPLNVLIAVGVLGVFVVLSLDQSNTLAYYEEWVKRGMP